MIGERRHRQALIFLALTFADPGLGGERDLARPFDCIGQRLIVDLPARPSVKDVKDDLLGAEPVELIDDLCLLGARPRPIVDLSQTFFVNFDDYDIAAGRMLMGRVAQRAQYILYRLTGLGKTKHQRKHQRPYQQLQPLAVRFDREGGLCQHSNPFIPRHAR